MATVTFGTKIKAPDIAQCPCCGWHTGRGRHPMPDPAPIGERYREAQDAEPRCRNVIKDDGTLVEAVLFWRCRRCGCEWRHGQYEDKKAVGVRVTEYGGDKDDEDWRRAWHGEIASHLANFGGKDACHYAYRRGFNAGAWVQATEGKA